MSHFTVLVIGDNQDAQMAPYQENNMGDCPKEFLQFIETEEDCVKQFENETTTKVKLPNGEYVFPWSELAKRLKENDPELYVEEQIPLNKVYESFDDYMEDYHGYKKDEKTGKYGYWTNPQSRWDWYVLGGRWRGNFKLKSGAEGITGVPGVFDNESKDGYVDVAKKGDIDWEGMLLDNLDDGKQAGRFWELYVEDQEPENAEEVKMKAGAFYKKEYYLKTYKNKKNYIRARVEFHTWAVLKDGIWSEPGEMGWWGMSNADRDDEREWQLSFYDKWIKDLPDDTELAVFDCHV